jgi:hypothetical protein
MNKRLEDETPDWLKDLEAQSERWESETITRSESNPFWLMVVVGIVVLSLIVLCFAFSWWT